MTLSRKRLVEADSSRTDERNEHLFTDFHGKFLSRFNLMIIVFVVEKKTVASLSVENIIEYFC